jgi:hypothetical protein
MSREQLSEFSNPIADAPDNGKDLMIRAAEPGGDELVEGLRKADVELTTPCFTFKAHYVG